MSTGDAPPRGTRLRSDHLDAYQRRVRGPAGLGRCTSGVVVLALAASTLVLGLTSPAKASICTPISPGCTTYEIYQVSGTPDNSLVEWSELPGNGGVILRSAPNGTPLYFICQINDGPQIDPEFNLASDGTYVPSRTWDLVYDPWLSRTQNLQLAWVYDWWLNTPPQQEAYNWYSGPDAAHRCNLP